MRKETLDKNLLSVAFGQYLARERATLVNSKSKDVAADIGISDSLLRMIESGSARIHPKYMLEFIRVFNGSKIQPDSLIELIVLIQHLDAFAGSCKAYSAAITELKEKASKYSRLLEPLERLVLEIQKPKPVNIPELEYELVKILEAFLSMSSLYNKSDVEIQELYPKKFFGNVPTNQIELFEKVKEYVLTQPTSYSSNTSWQWEKQNAHAFSHCYVLDTQPDLITGPANLGRYRYEYLWQLDFQKVCILFISDQPAAKYRDLFKKNLRTSLEAWNTREAKDMLASYDETIEEKVVIKCISSDEAKEYADQILRPTPENPYNAAWVFAMTNFQYVGVRAILEEGDARLAQGDYLTFDETLDVLKTLQDLWEKV